MQCFVPRAAALNREFRVRAVEKKILNPAPVTVVALAEVSWGARLCNP